VLTTGFGVYLSISLPIYAIIDKRRSIFRTSLSRLSFTLLLTSNLLFLIETAIVLWTLVQPTSDEAICRLQEKLTNVMMAVAFYPIYIFLWSRQLSIYRDPRLASALPKWLRAFSQFTLFMIVTILTGFVVILSSNFADPAKVYDFDGYCYKQDDWWSLFLAIGTMLIIQGLLLFLFWYPISTALTTGHSTLTNYVRRCAILTAINAISDVTTLAFMVVFIDKAPIPILAIVYPINLLVNVSCCIFSYRGGSSMVFPWVELCRRLSFKTLKSVVIDKNPSESTLKSCYQENSETRITSIQHNGDS